MRVQCGLDEILFKVTNLPMLGKRHVRVSVVGMALIAMVVFCVAGDRGLPAQNGILNFGRVNEHLYRGAEPNSAAVASLSKLGIKTIIDLRKGREVRVGEEADAASAGIIYTNIPLGGLGRPTEEDMDRILSVIEAAPGPVFVHCEHGCDRTGTVIACYRMRHEHLSAAEAQKEADLYGMSKLERGMRGFVASFKADLAKN